MKHFLIALALLAAPGVAAGETRTYTAGPFRAVEASGQFELTISRGETASVVLDGDADDLARMDVVVRNGKLIVRHSCTFFCNRQLDVEARVVAPVLTHILVSKGAQVRADNVAARSLDIKAAMGGALEITGPCESLRADVAMGGTIEARDLRCREVDADVTMGGTLRVFASESATADASMGGSVEVRGSPRERDAHTAMGGSVSFH